MPRYSMDDSSAISVSEYYDALSDYVSSSSSEEEDDEESALTDFSEDGVNYTAHHQAMEQEKEDAENGVIENQVAMVSETGRRSKLPCPQTDSSRSSFLVG